MPRLDLVKDVPRDVALATPAAEHLAPVALDGVAYALQGTEVPCYPEVRIVPLQEAVQVQGLLSNRQVPHPPHQVTEHRQGVG